MAGTPAVGADITDDTPQDSLEVPSRQLIPEELQVYAPTHTGSIVYRKHDSDSLLRFVSKPGHRNGEGCNRIFLGQHPDTKKNDSFLVGIEALWAEEELQSKRKDRLNGNGNINGHDPDGKHSQDEPAGSGHVVESELDIVDVEEQTDDESTASSSSSSDSEDQSDLDTKIDRQHNKKRSGSTRLSPDQLFDKLRGEDARKHLSSSGDQKTRASNTRQFSSRSRGLTSQRIQESPMSLDTHADSFFTARSVFQPNGATRSVRPETKDRVDEIPVTPLTEDKQHLELRHKLLRRHSQTLLPDTASDTLVFKSRSRPKLNNATSSKSVRWDATHKKSHVPKSKRLTGIDQLKKQSSGAQAAASPSEVLARAGPLDHPADSVPLGIPTVGQIVRSDSSESDKLLSGLAGSKAAALPPGVEKLERMLVRVGWTIREDLPEDYDELAARTFPVKYERWEEMAVAWRKDRLDFWGSYRDPFRRLIINKFQRKHVIPLTNATTRLSVYSTSDQIFSLRCPPMRFGHHITGKPALASKRHFHHPGTLVFLLRARSPSIAEDWYLGLHLALRKEKTQIIELHLPALDLQIRLNANAEQHETASYDAATVKAKKEVSSAIEDQDLLSKEEVLRTTRNLLMQRRDFAELLRSIDLRELKLTLAWRKGQIIEWLTHERSVDGLKRVWDIYTGAIMKQASQGAHRLEVYPETHYPTFVSTGHEQYLIEPPAIEGYVIRIRQRNDSQRERMYASTHCGFLVVCKASKAFHPEHPDAGSASAINHKHIGEPVSEWYKREKKRILRQMMKCKGCIRLRDIKTVEVHNLSEICKAKKKDKGIAAGIALAIKGMEENERAVCLEMSDGRKIRFETTPPGAVDEWAGRLRALVEYWTKREVQDARDQVSLSQNDAVRPRKQRLDELASLPPFQAREIEDTLADPTRYSPLLPQCFHVCVIKGCRHNVLKGGRIYHKRGHPSEPFQDRYLVLINDHLIEFETTRRNFQKRPVPLSYHRRVRTIRLRDVYLISAESCSEFMAKTSQTTFDPSADQSSLARIYKDGLVSVDDPMDCTVAIWRQKGTEKAVALGRKGEAFIFQARSRLERDQWIQALNAACESIARTSREREIRIATFKNIL